MYSETSASSVFYYCTKPNVLMQNNLRIVLRNTVQRCNTLTLVILLFNLPDNKIIANAPELVVHVIHNLVNMPIQHLRLIAICIELLNTSNTHNDILGIMISSSDAELWCFLQSWGWWFETPSHPWRRHCDDFNCSNSQTDVVDTFKYAITAALTKHL